MATNLQRVQTTAIGLTPPPFFSKAKKSTEVHNPPQLTIFYMHIIFNLILMYWSHATQLASHVPHVSVCVQVMYIPYTRKYEHDVTFRRLCRLYGNCQKTYLPRKNLACLLTSTGVPGIT